MRRKVTMAQLAAELGLSRLTVSKALKGSPGMSEDTRKAVLELAQRRGYRTREQLESASLENTPMLRFAPRRFAFALAGERMAGERMALPDLHLKLMRGAAERYQNEGHAVMPLFLPEEDMGESRLTAWLEESGLPHFDGLFIPPMLRPDQERLLLRAPLPRILMNFPPAGARADSVVWDSYEAVRQAVHYLLASGRSRILFVGDNKSVSGYRWRWGAFRDAMEEAGLTAETADHVTVPRTNESLWRETVAAQLRKAKPEAVVCALEHDFPWVVYLCGQEGLRVPEDCEVVGLRHSDAEGEAAGHSAFVYLPVKETGARAADRMIWRIANPNAAFEHIRIQGRLIVPGAGARRQGK